MQFKDTAIITIRKPYMVQRLYPKFIPLARVRSHVLKTLAEPSRWTKHKEVQNIS